jgi:hypothetical protein
LIKKGTKTNKNMNSNNLDKINKNYNNEIYTNKKSHLELFPPSIILPKNSKNFENQNIINNTNNIINKDKNYLDVSEFNYYTNNNHYKKNYDTLHNKNPDFGLNMKNYQNNFTGKKESDLTSNQFSEKINISKFQNINDKADNSDKYNKNYYYNNVSINSNKNKNNQIIYIDKNQKNQSEKLFVNSDEKEINYSNNYNYSNNNDLYSNQIIETPKKKSVYNANKTNNNTIIRKRNNYTDNKLNFIEEKNENEENYFQNSKEKEKDKEKILFNNIDSNKNKNISNIEGNIIQYIINPEEVFEKLNDSKINNYINNNYYDNNILFDNQDQTNKNYDNNQNLNYENFTQEFFMERYKQFLPSKYVTPTPFCKDISQFMKDDISRKSDITRIINIKCNTNNNEPNIGKNHYNYNTFNLSNKISYKENEKDNEKINNENFNYKRNKNEKNEKKDYLYDNIEKKKNFKFDFFSFGNSLKKYHDLFSDCPFPIEEFNINMEENINSNKDIYNNDNLIYELDFNEKNIYNWILSYNKILTKEKFVKENSLKNFKSISPDFINSILSLNFKKFMDENSNINNSTENNEFIPYNNSIIKNLSNFFANFSLKNLLKKNIFFLEIRQIYFIDSLMHIEAIDYFGNKINLAYILPVDYFEDNFISSFNCDKRNYSDNNINNSMKHSNKKKININDIIILKSKNFNFSDSHNNIRIFIEEKDFDLINSIYI